MRASQKEFDGALWFFTEASTPKTGEVAQDERVLLAYSDPSKQNYVSIYGQVELVRDAEMQKRLWAEPLRTWFPGGAEAPEVALLKVTCEGAEYWDSPSSTLVHAYGYLKAITTGEPPHPGANERWISPRPRADNLAVSQSPRLRMEARHLPVSGGPRAPPSSVAVRRRSSATSRCRAPLAQQGGEFRRGGSPVR